MDSFPSEEFFHIVVINRNIENLIFTRDCELFRKIVFDEMLNFYDIVTTTKDGKEEKISKSYIFSHISVDLSKPNTQDHWNKDVVKQIGNELQALGWQIQITYHALLISKEKIIDNELNINIIS